MLICKYEFNNEIYSSYTGNIAGANVNQKTLQATTSSLKLNFCTIANPSKPKLGVNSITKSPSNSITNSLCNSIKYLLMGWGNR